MIVTVSNYEIYRDLKDKQKQAMSLLIDATKILNDVGRNLEILKIKSEEDIIRDQTKSSGVLDDSYKFVAKEGMNNNHIRFDKSEV